MSLQPLIATVVVPLLLSAAGMAYGAHQSSRSIVVLSALVFAVAVLFVGARINRPHWQPAAGPTREPDALFHAMRRNTRLAALVYAWGAAAFFAVYGLSGVYWRHGFQYGTAAALIAGGLLYYVHRLGAGGRTAPPARVLTVLHGAAVAGGLAFLLSSGKLASLRGDWPANSIFLFGGLTLLGLCFLAYRTQSILETVNRPPG